MPKARHRTVHDAGVDFTQAIIVEAKRFHAASAEVFQYHVADGYQPGNDLTRLFSLHIQVNAVLAAVVCVPVAAGIEAAVFVGKRWIVAHDIHAFTAFYLDHLHAQVAQQLSPVKQVFFAVLHISCYQARLKLVGTRSTLRLALQNGVICQLHVFSEQHGRTDFLYLRAAYADVAIFAWEYSTGPGGTMAAAGAFAHHPGIGILFDGVFQDIGNTLLSCNVYVLANAVQITVEQRGSSGVGGMHGGSMLCLLSPGHGRGVICRPCNAHQTTHGVCDDVAGFVARVGTRLSKTSDGAVDQPGIDGVELFIAQPQGGQRANGPIFDQQVGAAGQFTKQFLPTLRLEVQSDTLLVAVMMGKMQARLWIFFAVGKRTNLSRQAAARRLNQDYLGAIVTEHFGTVHTANGAGQIQHYDVPEEGYRCITSHALLLSYHAQDKQKYKKYVGSISPIAQ